MEAEAFSPMAWTTSDGRYVIRLLSGAETGVSVATTNQKRFRAYRMAGVAVDERSALYESFGAACAWCARDKEECGE